MGSPGINIGDAVLTFIGDATQLDQTLKQVNSAAQSQMAPAREQAKQLGAALDDTQVSATSAQSAFDNLAKKTVDYTVVSTTLKNTLRALATGELPITDSTIKSLSQDMQKATAATAAKTDAMRALKTALAPATAEIQAAAAAEDQHTRSLTDARYAAMLAGQELGVRMPRAMTTLIARSETLGPLLNAAFSGIAVVGFIQLAVTAGEKIYEFIQSLHELSAAEKQGISEYTALLQAAEQRSQHILQQERERQLIGKTATEQAQLRAQFAAQDAGTLDGLLQREQKRYDIAKQTIALYNSGAVEQTGDTALMPDAVPVPIVSDDQMKQAEKTVQEMEDLYGKGLEKLQNQSAIANNQISVDQKQAQQTQLDQYIQNSETILAAQKQKDQAEIAERRAQAALDFETGKISLAQLLELDQQYDKQDHDATVRNLEDKRALLQKDPTKNAAAISAINLEIAAENDRFRAQELTREKDAHQQQAQSVLAAMKDQVAATKQGTADRVAAEQAVTDFVRKTWGENSAQYKQQIAVQTAADREYANARQRLADELAKVDLASEQALTKEKLSADQKYYQTLYQYGQLSFDQLMQLKRNEIEQQYLLDVQAIQARLNELDPSKVLDDREIAERQRLEDELTRLDQKRVDDERQLDTQAANSSILIEEKKQLEIKKLRAQQGVSGAIFTDADEKRLEGINNQLAKMAINWSKNAFAARSFFDVNIHNAPKLGQIWTSLGNVGKQVVDESFTALQQSIAAAILSQQSFGQALESALANVLAQTSAEMAVNAIKWTAYGFAALAAMDYQAAGNWFTAAAVAGGVAVGAGAAAAAIDPANTSSSSSSGSSSANSGVQVAAGDATPATSPVQTINVHRFATGALISQPTLLVAGDSMSGGAADEAILPLENERALKKIAAALGPHLAAMGGGDTHIHMPNVRGVISADVIDKVIDQVNTRVSGGKKLVASHARRLEKR